MKLSIAFLCIVASIITSKRCFAEHFPFVIPGDDAFETATDFSHLSDGPAGKHGFVRVENGHFVTDSGRLKLWGVNVGYGGCFPSHEDADKIAPHLAKLGINAVRIHHHESQFSPTGLLREDGSFDPAQVDRLDYFLAQLHKHGIYANLNLHVGRVASRRLKLPQLGNSFDTTDDKHALHFQPELQAAYRDFCREFLTHENPYRKLRRVDDPAIAMIEMCNENSFTRAGPSLIRSAPEPYKGAIKKKWNQWLAKRYPDQTAEQAWRLSEGKTQRALTDSTRWTADAHGGWQANNANEDAPLTIETKTVEESVVVRLIPQGNVQEAWHQQYASGPLPLTDENDFYTLKFDCRADANRHIDLHLSTTENGDWEPLGLVETMAATNEWKTFQFRFRATRKIKAGARITFSLGGNETPVELKNLSFRNGVGAWSLPSGQSFAEGNVELPAVDWPPIAQEAIWRFMLDTETEFYSSMKHYLRKDLGVRVPLLTTQVDYQKLSISSRVSDFQDMHVYWHHPEFPGEDWDPNNWLVQNETLLAYPFHNDWPRVNLNMRAGWRVHEQPFTISEWNTGEPNFYSADAIPMAAMMASLQDWDAVFFFDYHNRRDLWNADHIQNFFEMNGQPCKTALLGPLANLYRRGDLAKLSETLGVPFGQHEAIGPLSLRYRVGIQVDGEGKSLTNALQQQMEAMKKDRLLSTPSNSVVWNANRAKPFAVIDTPRTKCVWGVVGERSLSTAKWRFDVGEIERDYAVITVTSRDGKPLATTRSALIVALANAENSGMHWNEERTSVGANWGEGPTMVNGVPVRITLPANDRTLSVYALDATGKRQTKAPIVHNDDGTISFELGPEFRTLFYELSAE